MTDLRPVLDQLATLEDPKVRAANEKRGDDHGLNLAKLRERWFDDTDPRVAAAAWALTAVRVAEQPVAGEPDGLDLDGLLTLIDPAMRDVPAPLQWSMNETLAQIGIHHPAYRDRAIEIGERLQVLADYPTSKGCTSPYAPTWIAEMVRRQDN